MANPVFLAVDTTDLAEARRLASACAPHIGGLKLGLEFFAAHGPAGVAAFVGQGLPIFLDLKLHDIPNTVAGAVAALAPLAPAMLTIHAAGGPAMIAAARAAAPKGTAIIAVTVLTSIDGQDLARIGVPDAPAVQAPRLAALAHEAGADGIVCSPHEAAAIRAAWPDGLLVVPGVRPAGSASGDQKRIMTPADAMAAGASVLVIGRPITAAADPAAAAAAIAASL
jgi:orotidine-5'-phosphate decarboxylase